MLLNIEKLELASRSSRASATGRPACSSDLSTNSRSRRSAVARLTGEPLLCVGRDVPEADLQLVGAD